MIFVYLNDSKHKQPRSLCLFFLQHLSHFFPLNFPGICTGFEVDEMLHFYLSEGRRRSKSDGSDSGEESMSKKELALQQALDQITSAFGKGSIMWLGRSVSPKHVPVVSTGSFALDIALGIGGLPKVSLNPCIKKFLAHLLHVNKP